MRRIRLVLFTLTAATLLARAGDQDAIQAAMKYANKAPKGTAKVCEKIVDGTATAEEVSKTLELYKAMRSAKPAKGDAAGFMAKTDGAITALEAVLAKKDGAGEAFKMANNCKACHSEHKPD